VVQALPKAMADFLADHLVLVRAEALKPGVRYDDGFDRHTGLIEGLRRFILALSAVGTGSSAGVVGDLQ
jgi:hypothetical protein